MVIDLGNGHHHAYHHYHLSLQCCCYCDYDFVLESVGLVMVSNCWLPLQLLMVIFSSNCPETIAVMEFFDQIERNGPGYVVVLEIALEKRVLEHRCLETFVVSCDMVQNQAERMVEVLAA